jgi:hypothetical protein
MGHAHIQHDVPGGASAAYHALRAAMSLFEEAAKYSPPGSEDAILRWNTCARVIMKSAEEEESLDDEQSDVWVRNEAGSRIADV